MNTQRITTTTILGLGFLLMLLLSNMPLPQARAQTGMDTIHSQVASSDVGRLDNAAATPIYSSSGMTATGKANGTSDYPLGSSYRKQNVNGKSYSPLVAHSSSSGGFADGDFENGHDGSWGEFSTHDWEIVLNTTVVTNIVPAHSGIWEAWLGGDYDDVSYITQSVAIPAGGPILTYWQWIDSEDVCDYDWAEVVVNDDTVVSYTLCSDVNTNGWVTRTVDLSAYAGQAVQLQFRVETDSSYNSSLFVDDVALESTSAQHLVYLPFCAKNYCSGTIFFDNFTNPNSQWGAWENSEYKFGGLNGEFQIILKNTNSWFWDTPSLVLPSDYVMEVDARHATGNLGNYGLMFGVRYSGNDPIELYQFIVSPSSREYFLEKYNNGTWTTLIDWTYDSRINYGMATNHLMVERVGTSISVGVNSYWLNTVYDGDFIGAGRDGGLKVFSYASAPTDMRFDNFLVTCPQSAAAPTPTPTPTRTPTPTPTPTSAPVVPSDGTWTGTTNNGYPVTLVVYGSGTHWSYFQISQPNSCGGGLTMYLAMQGGGIVNGRITYNTNFPFTAQFTTSTTVTGTFTVNDTSCGYSIPKSGTWTAHAP